MRPNLPGLLTKKGVPFRDAYRCVGELVAWCIERSCALNDVSLEDLQQFHPLFGSDVYEAIDLQTCVRECEKHRADRHRTV